MLAGALKVTVACAFATVAVPMIGAEGTVILELTVCVRTLDVLGALFASPEYAPVIACAPTVSKLVPQAACAPDTDAEQNVAAPSRNVTIPVGALPVIEAVNVTFCPKVLGFGDEEMVVLLAELVELTVCVNGVEELPL